MGQQRRAASPFDLVHDPIPIADRLQSDGRSGWKLGQETLDGSPLVVHPGPLLRSTLRIEDGEERVVLVSVTTDRIMRLVRHVAPPVHTDGVDTTSVAGGAALSYNQLDGADTASAQE